MLLNKLDLGFNFARFPVCRVSSVMIAKWAGLVGKCPMDGAAPADPLDSQLGAFFIFIWPQHVHWHWSFFSFERMSDVEKDLFGHKNKDPKVWSNSRKNIRSIFSGSLQCERCVPKRIPGWDCLSRALCALQLPLQSQELSSKRKRKLCVRTSVIDVVYFSCFLCKK